MVNGEEAIAYVPPCLLNQGICLKRGCMGAMCIDVTKYKQVPRKILMLRVKNNILYIIDLQYSVYAINF